MILKHLLHENNILIRDMAKELDRDAQKLGIRLKKKENLKLSEIIYLIKKTGMSFEEIFKEELE